MQDVLQNHLLQLLSLLAMEPPVSRAADDIQNEKVKLLRSTKSVATTLLLSLAPTSRIRGGPTRTERAASHYSGA